MMETLLPIITAIESGDKKLARRLLRPLLASSPSAELWYLAAQACETAEHESACLQRALALEPTHGKARARLAQLKQGADPTPRPPQPPNSALAPAQPRAASAAPFQQPEAALQKRVTVELSREELRALKKARPTRKGRGPWAYIGCLSMIVMSLAASYLVLLVLGSAVPAQVRSLITGEQAPFSSQDQIEGTPVRDRPDAVIHARADLKKPLDQSGEVTDILEPGYTHEYSFEVFNGEEIAVYVQFVSLTARSVRRNVAVFDSMGRDAENRCQRDQILQDGTGTIFDCFVDESGIWSVRIFGREGESTGVYVVSVQRFLQ